MANSNGWGDGAANNSIGWGQGANNNIGWGDSHAKSWAGATDIVGFDSSAISYFNATGISGATQQDAIDNLVRGLKADGLWSKMKAVYPFVTDNRNLFDYTEDFSNAYWIKPNATVTNNSVIAPNGTLTADTIAFGSAGTVQKTLLSNGNITFSIYAKYISTQWLFIENYNNADLGAWFDIQNGLIGTIASGVTANIENAGNGWFRCSVTMLTTNASNSIYAAFNTTANGNYTRTGSAYFWGAQVELGSTATTYQRIATTQQAYIANQFKYNLVNPVDSDAAFRLVFNGGWTHSSNGATPNGTNGYADTKLNISSEFTSQTQSFSFYTPVSNSTSNVLGGVTNGTSTTQFFNPIGQYNILGTSYVKSSAMSNGFILMSQPSSNNTSAYEKGVKLGTFSQAQSALINFNYYIAARNFSNTADSYANRQFSFAHIGNGLTDTEAANLYTRVQAFQNSLNRAV